MSSEKQQANFLSLIRGIRTMAKAVKHTACGRRSLKAKPTLPFSQPLRCTLLCKKMESRMLIKYVCIPNLLLYLSITCFPLCTGLFQGLTKMGPNVQLMSAAAYCDALWGKRDLEEKCITAGIREGLQGQVCSYSGLKKGVDNLFFKSVAFHPKTRYSPACVCCCIPRSFFNDTRYSQHRDAIWKYPCTESYENVKDMITKFYDS